MDTAVSSGFKLAVQSLTEVLNHPPAQPTAQDEYVLGIAYRTLMEAASQANYYRQLPDSLVTEFTGILTLQQNRINQALVQGDYRQQYYTSLDLAAVYRLAGDLTSARATLADVLTWNQPAEEDHTALWLCYYTAEDDLRAGRITRPEFIAAVQACQQPLSPRQRSPEITSSVNENKPLLSVAPNPGTGIFLLRLIREETPSVSVYNALGERLLSFTPGNREVVLDLTTFGKGLYLLQAAGSNGNLQTEKVVVE